MFAEAPSWPSFSGLAAQSQRWVRRGSLGMLKLPRCTAHSRSSDDWLCSHPSKPPISVNKAKHPQWSLVKPKAIYTPCTFSLGKFYPFLSDWVINLRVQALLEIKLACHWVTQKWVSKQRLRPEGVAFWGLWVELDSPIRLNTLISKHDF